MRSPRQETTPFAAPPQAAFQAALGVMQHTKNITLLAAHNTGYRLVARERPKMSNAKFLTVQVRPTPDGASQLDVVVGTDPRTTKALLDGRANDKLLKTYLDGVRGALDGSAPAPASPVADHFMQKKEAMPWVDGTQDPDIELDGNIRAMLFNL